MRTFLKTLKTSVLLILFYGLYIICSGWQPLQADRVSSQSIYEATTAEKCIFKNNALFLDRKMYHSKMRELNRTIPLEILGKTNFDRLIRKFPNKANDCTKLPHYKDIKFNNIYWQELKVSIGKTAYLYRAYYDNRTLIADKPSIRIISVLHTNISSNIKYCQIWLPPNKLITSEVTSVIFDKRPQDVDSKTCIITCKIPKLYNSIIPIGVSLLENECDNATNLLKVNHNLPANGIKEGVAVCGKALDYPHEDISIYLIQWLELFDILGFSKVFLYTYETYPTTKRVLQYYQSLGRIEVIPLTIPGTHPNLYGLLHTFLYDYQPEKRIYEKVSRNDCYYMNMNKYKYIVIQDTDEIIIPTNGKSIQETFDFINSKLINISNDDIYAAPSGYIFHGFVFTDELRQQYGIDPNIPPYMSLLQNVYRGGKTNYIKSVLTTEKSLVVSTHTPHYCVGNCTRTYVPCDVAYIHHYRSGERINLHTDTVINDTNIWSHKEEMVSRVEKIVNILNLIPA